VGDSEQGAEKDGWTWVRQGKRRRVNNEELHDLCCSPNVITGDQTKEEDLGRGRVLGMYERKDKWIQDFGQETCRKETTKMT
jgi:hypothetical protein